MHLRQEGDVTLATISTELRLSGRVGGMGQAVIGDVAKRLVDTFSGNLSSMLGPPSPAPESREAGPAEPGSPEANAAPPEGGAALSLLSVGGSVLVSRLRSRGVALPLAVASLLCLGALAWLRWR
jgi:hypothetical protein